MSKKDQPPAASSVTVLGLPWDGGSSFLRGSAQAPGRIREALLSPAGNLSTEAGVDLGAEDRWRLADDLVLAGDHAAVRQRIEDTVSDLLASGSRVLSLGGDHSVTHPLLRAYRQHWPELEVLHLDAHADLYDELDGERHTHASPFARALEDGCMKRLVQVGVRTLNPHQRSQAERFGVEVLEMRHLPRALPPLSAPLYLSIDLDVLDPAFAPGVSHHEPGGLSTRELLRIVQQLEVPVVGADIVELNPSRDVRGITAAVAGKVLKEVLAVMLGGLSP